MTSDKVLTELLTGGGTDDDHRQGASADTGGEMSIYTGYSGLTWSGVDIIIQLLLTVMVKRKHTLRLKDLSSSLHAIDLAKYHFHDLFSACVIPL